MTQSESAKAKAEKPCKVKALVSEKTGSLSESEKGVSNRDTSCSNKISFQNKSMIYVIEHLQVTKIVDSFSNISLYQHLKALYVNSYDIYILVYLNQI